MCSKGLIIIARYAMNYVKMKCMFRYHMQSLVCVLFFNFPVKGTSCDRIDSPACPALLNLLC